MNKTITIKDRVGLFDNPTFYVSDNEDLTIYIKRADGKPLKNYRLIVKHGNLYKVFTIFNNNTIDLKAEWIIKNSAPIEFELVQMDNANGKIAIGEGLEIEPLRLEKMQGKFEFSAMVQELHRWQEQHGRELNILKKRFDEYEQNGINIDVVTEE